ncbi:uncharacterized protein ACBR49_013202 isoform 2-T2 [Aulostomus maculatus]
MKKGALSFLSRKNQSLFDTNVKMKDMDNHGLHLTTESPAILESGTASVRARPTVKHHSPSAESFQGFAVPTPKVPLLPPVNSPKINGSVGSLSNGSVILMPDLVESDIFVPPPPSVAPPPPPGMESVITTLPGFKADLNSPDLTTLQPPSMPAPKPPSLQLEELPFLKPPSMAPPKPPSTCSTISASSIPMSIPPPAHVPERPNFAPPPPPTERQQKKIPPAKPVRLSSMSILDSPPQTPAPPPPVQTPTLSTFNPHNTAKLYNVPANSVLSGYEESDSRPKQMLLMEDSGSVKSIHVHADGKVAKVAPKSKPTLEDVLDPKGNLQTNQPSQSLLPQPVKEANKVIASAQQEQNKDLQPPHEMSPKLQKANSSLVNTEEDKLEEFPSQGYKFSPLLDRKLRNLKNIEANKAPEAPAASPLALLKAAKEREKHKPSNSQKNSFKSTEPTSASIQHDHSNPNSFIVTPRSRSSSTLTSQETVEESPASISPHDNTIQIPQASGTIEPVIDQMPSTSPASGVTAAASNLVNDNTEANMPLLPPPPEFGDFDEIMEPPPSLPPPDPPSTKAPKLNRPTEVPPPPAKPIPPPPKLPPPDMDIRPKSQFHAKPKLTPVQVPATLSPSQATLLSILQKKMLEMDHKITPMKDADSSLDDWSTPLSDEEKKVPVVPKTTPQSKSYPVVNKAATMDMRELEGKLSRKQQDMKKESISAPLSKHQYGMTFTVRPGTKHPITPVIKGESS